MKRCDLVIIGSGLAGLNLVKALRKLGDQRPITLFTQEAGHFYAKPMLSNALGKGKTPANIPMQSMAAFASEYQVDIQAAVTVSSVDVHAQCVMVAGQAYSWRNLVLATGARPCRLRDWGLAVEGTIHTVNQLSEYDDFYQDLMRVKAEYPDRPARVLIVGSGLIGCEFANDLAAQGIAVSMVDLADRPMARLLPPELSNALAAALTGLGVKGYWQERVVAIRQHDAEYQLNTASGLTLTADLVLSAVGLMPQTALAASAGLACGPGIRVNRLLETSVSGVYALGDCATVEGLSLQYVLPLMACTRALANTLHGTPTPVTYPAMPVVVKTPACPLVLCVPPNTSNTVWSVSGKDLDLKGLLHDASGQLVGFALSGACVSEKHTLTSALPALLS
ncbi:MAG: FAD-dependent oxidoreductase [Gammaproteobacteria bacterium]